MAQLAEMIRFTQMEHLSLFTEIFQINLIILFLGCIGNICITLLMIELDMVSFSIGRRSLTTCTYNLIFIPHIHVVVQ